MTDYFAPGIVPFLRYLWLDSKQVTHELGDQVGRKAAAKMPDEFARVWQASSIGTLAVESRNPIVIQISNCTVCGQLDGMGGCSKAPSTRGSSRVP